MSHFHAVDLGSVFTMQSQASISDLNNELEKAKVKERSSPAVQSMSKVFGTLPGGEGHQMSRDMENVQRMSDPNQGGKKPEEMSPQELHSALWQILTFRDSGMLLIRR
jgi:hypothetical protein